MCMTNAAKKLILLASLVCVLFAIVVWRFLLQEDSNKTAVTPSQPSPKSSYTPPEVKDPKLVALVNRESKKPRVTPDITSKIPKITDEKDLKVVQTLLMDANDDPTVRHEAANLLRRSDYRGLTDDLVKILDNPKEGEKFRSWSVQHLWLNVEKAGEKECKKITAVLHRCLEDRHVKVRREALLALHQMKDPKAKEVALKWLHAEKSDGQRDAAIRIVREQDLREELPAIRKYARDPDIIVARAAIVTLAHWGDKASRPLFEEAARSKNVLLQRAGKAALKKLDKAKNTP